jgi:dihydrolipoamide dehydrogenase
MLDGLAPRQIVQQIFSASGFFKRSIAPLIEPPHNKVARDAVQKRRERPARFVIARALRQQRQKSFLRHVFRDGHATGHVEREAVHGPLAAMVQRGERALISFKGLRQQFLIGFVHAICAVTCTSPFPELWFHENGLGTLEVHHSIMTYDVIVIGSGPGGYSAAVRAGQYGLKTALIEKDPRLGGCCLLVGCIPTKAFLHTADVWEHFQHPEADGIHCENPQLDFPMVSDRKNSIVSKHSKGIEFLMRKNKVDVIKGYATLAGPGKIDVLSDDGAKTLEAKAIVLATGSEARMLPGLQPDAQRIFTNIEILNLRHVPKSLAVLGAGAVGVEFASAFHRFGSKVTIFEMLPRIVPVEDEEVSKELLRAFKKQGIRVETGAKLDPASVQKTETGVRFNVTLDGGKVENVEAECLLIAVGRKPNTENLGLEAAGVQLDRGFVKVDQFQRTGAPGVYAIGDIVAGTPQLAHVATAEGMVAIAHIAGKPATPINKDRIPGATYTEPGIGSVGLTEAQARAKGYKVKIGKFPFMANSKATILGQHDGFVKVVAEEELGEILGVHIIGPQAYELIGEGVLAMEAEATVETLMHTIHAHPTIYEAVGEAFNAVYGLAINA